MRSFPRADVRLVDVPNTVPLSEKDIQLLGFAPSGVGGGSFVLSPGHQAIGGGQVPQVLPGQQSHDGSPPAAPSNPQVAAASPLSVSATPQSTPVGSSPLPPVAPPTSQIVNPSIESASAASVLSPGSSSAQTSAATSATSPSSEGTLSPSSLLSSVPLISSGTVATATVPTSITSPSLASVSATSSSTLLPAAAITSSTTPHGSSFWAGIALLIIAGVATLITLFVWWLRVRERTHRYPWELPRWRWGRAESYKFPEEAISSSGVSGSWWQPQGDRDVGEPRRSTNNLSSPSLLSRGTSRTGREPRPHLPVLTAMSPFPTMRPLPLELRFSDTSVPGLMQDVGGSLCVANLVAGDMLTSGDESSRPPTVLDDVGTPRESSVMLKPRYLSLNGSGLDMPWIQTSSTESELGSQPTSAGATAPLNYNRWRERLERSSAKPVESDTNPQPGTIESWRDSLRNNIATALGGFPSATPVSVPTAPVRPSVTAYNWQHAASAIARAPSTASTTSKPWTLEETRDGAGIVHIRGVPNPFTSASSSSFGSRALPPTPSPPPRASLVPPRLPHLPPMPYVPRTSITRSTSTRRQHGSRRRRALSRGASSSTSSVAASVAASEATSVGSDMSRASLVARWARLSEKEEAARRALRQRRLQSVGSGSGVRKRMRGGGGDG